jgi:hypothetical protein
MHGKWCWEWCGSGGGAGSGGGGSSGRGCGGAMERFCLQFSKTYCEIISNNILGYFIEMSCNNIKKH